MILILILGVVLAAAQVSHAPIPPEIKNVRFSPVIKTVPSGTAFTATFPALGYEIGGSVFETHDGLLNEQIHSKRFYNKSSSCQLYNS